jgi:hypothetical protein
MATAARFSSGAMPAGAARVNAAQSAPIFRLVASSKDRMALDYNSSAFDEMAAHRGMVEKAK